MPITLLVCSLVLASCLSVAERKVRAAEQNYSQGDYDAAFDAGYESLLADAFSDRQIRIFPDLVWQVRRLHHERIRGEWGNNWDSTARSYDRLKMVNERLATIQQRHAEERRLGGKRFDRQVTPVELDRIAALPQEKLEPEFSQSHNSAAASHYQAGLKLADQKSYRQAVAEFRQALFFIPGYRDAENRAWRNEQLANEQDATIAYNNGTQLAARQEYRRAQQAFESALGFVPNFRDAAALANRYRGLADLADAEEKYSEGTALAASGQYRQAAAALAVCLRFVPNFRDAAVMQQRYIRLADEQEAQQHYEQGLRLMLDQRYDQAEHAFEAAERLVPGFKDARHRAQLAHEAEPPAKAEIQRAINEALIQGVPLSWVGAPRGHTEHIQLTNMTILWNGPYDTRQRLWPLRVQLLGNCTLEEPGRPEEQRLFNVTVNFQIQRLGSNGLRAWLVP